VYGIPNLCLKPNKLDICLDMAFLCIGISSLTPLSQVGAEAS